MQARSATRKAGIFILAFLMLFLASGMHSRIGHIEHIRAHSAETTADSPTFNPAHEQCSACLFQQFLTQCLITAVHSIHASELFLFQDSLFFDAEFRSSLKNEVNRGPPPRSYFL
jgi:hypothetical protein